MLLGIVHRRRRIILGVLSCPLVGGVVLAGLLLFDQSQADRDREINRTLDEIHRGNYFAWGQVWMWMGRLTPAEEKTLTEACGQYALTNQLLHVTGIVWPPEPTPTTFRSWSAWFKGAVGVEDRTLAFDVIQWPPRHDVHLSAHEGLYHLPEPTAPPPAAAVRVATVLNLPPANRGQ